MSPPEIEFTISAGQIVNGISAVAGILLLNYLKGFIKDVKEIYRIRLDVEDLKRRVSRLEKVDDA